MHSIDELIAIERKQVKPVIVLGNGPSIKDYDLDKLNERYTTIGTNAIGMKINPDYYIITDKRAWTWYHQYTVKSVKKGSKLIIGKILSRSEETKKNPPHKDHYILDYNPSKAIGEPTPGGCIYHGRTVGVIALNLAYQMGFNPVYMLGIDGFGATSAHFHDAHLKENAKVTNADARDDVVYANLILLKKAFNKQNRHLIDLSTRSLWSNIVPKGNLHDKP